MVDIKGVHMLLSGSGGFNIQINEFLCTYICHVDMSRRINLCSC